MPEITPGADDVILAGILRRFLTDPGGNAYVLFAPRPVVPIDPFLMIDAEIALTAEESEAISGVFPATSL